LIPFGPVFTLFCFADHPSICETVVCSISAASEDLSSLIITRLEKGKEPVVARIRMSDMAPAAVAAPTKKAASKSTSSTPAPTTHLNPFLRAMKSYKEVMAENTATLDDRTSKRVTPASSGLASSADNAEFWRKRKDQNIKMKRICDDLSSKVLGWTKILLLGRIWMTKGAEPKISPPRGSILGEIPAKLLYLMISGSEFLSDAELEAAIRWCLGSQDIDSDDLTQASKAARTLFQTYFAKDPNVESIEALAFEERGSDTVPIVTNRPKRHPVVLILDKRTFCMASSIPLDKSHAVAFFTDSQMLPWESTPVLLNFPVSRMPSLALLQQLLRSYDSTMEKNAVRDGLDCRDGFYILNPSGDVKSAEELISKQMDTLKLGWDGVTGKEPAADVFTDAINKKGTLPTPPDLTLDRN
jgi:hypothetical protein